MLRTEEYVIDNAGFAEVTPAGNLRTTIDVYNSGAALVHIFFGADATDVSTGIPLEPNSGFSATGFNGTFSLFAKGTSTLLITGD